MLAANWVGMERRASELVARALPLGIDDNGGDDCELKKQTRVRRRRQRITRWTAGLVPVTPIQVSHRSLLDFRRRESNSSMYSVVLSIHAGGDHHDILDKTWG